MSDDSDPNEVTPPVEPAPAPPVEPAPEPVEPSAPVEEVVVEPLDVSGGVPEDRPADPIGVVMPGDYDGLAALVVRSIGMGDSGKYEGAPVDVIKARQTEAGLEPDGIVAGPTWALVLRTKVKRGDAGWEVSLLRGLLGLGDGVYDQALVDLVGEEFDDYTWHDAIAGASV